MKECPRPLLSHDPQIVRLVPWYRPCSELITLINVIRNTNTVADIHHPEVRKHSSITVYYTVDLLFLSFSEFLFFVPVMKVLRDCVCMWYRDTDGDECLTPGTAWHHESIPNLISLIQKQVKRSYPTEDETEFDRLIFLGRKSKEFKLLCKSENINKLYN